MVGYPQHVFMNVTTFEGVKGLCFVVCPTCKKDVCVTINEWARCKGTHKINYQKRVYRLKPDKRMKCGFSQIIYANVKDFRRTTLKELEA